MSEDTRIETSDAIDFLGVAITGDINATPCCSAWKYFGQIAGDASISRVGKDIYGLRLYHPQFPKVFERTYMACITKESGMDVPIRMIEKRLPAARYAVQKAENGVSGIDQALIYLYQDFIPKNGLRVVMPIDFEKYCNVQDHESVPDDIEIWVPVEEA